MSQRSLLKVSCVTFGVTNRRFVWKLRWLKQRYGKVSLISRDVASSFSPWRVPYLLPFTEEFHRQYQLYHTALPPSTSMLISVMNDDSSEAKNKQAEATSLASQSRPSGTLDRNFPRFSGVSGRPLKDSNLDSRSTPPSGFDLNRATVATRYSHLSFRGSAAWCS